MNITDEELLQALDRIAQTPDGELLYIYLQRVLMGLLVGDGVKAGALRADHGRRSLAHELMARMGKGIEQRDGRTDPATGQRTERPVVFRTAKPVDGRRVTAREWIAATDDEYARVIRPPSPGDG